jgi:hypothetical protein
MNETCSKNDWCPLPADHDGFCQAPESWQQALGYLVTARTAIKTHYSEALGCRVTIPEND